MNTSRCVPPEFDTNLTVALGRAPPIAANRNNPGASALNRIRVNFLTSELSTQYGHPGHTKAAAQFGAVAFVLDFYITQPISDFDGLNLKLDLDVIAHHDAARLQRLIPSQSPVSAIDLAPRAEPNALPAPGILGLPLELNVESNRLGHVANGKSTREREVLFPDVDTRALELDLGIHLYLQKSR